MRRSALLFLIVVAAWLPERAEPKSSQAAAPAAAQPLPRNGGLPDAAGQPPRVSSAADEMATHIDYQLYVHGLRIGRLEAGLGIHEANYRIEVAFRTFGLASWFFRGHQLDVAEGRMGRRQPEPHRFSGDGLWHGAPRRVLIDYVGGQPVVRDVEPPNEVEREPVSAAFQANTIDTLSAMVLLIQHVAESGRCDATTNTFDGRRAVLFSARTTGQQVLEATGRSSFQGQTLRCDFEGKVLAGFKLDDNAEERAKARHGTAWFAAVVPGAPLLPVRIQFETTWFGDATMYMIGAGSGSTRSPEAE